MTSLFCELAAAACVVDFAAQSCENCIDLRETARKGVLVYDGILIGHEKERSRLFRLENESSHNLELVVVAGTSNRLSDPVSLIYPPVQSETANCSSSISETRRSRLNIIKPFTLKISSV